MKWAPWVALAVCLLLLTRERYLSDKAMERLAVNVAATRLLEDEADSLRVLVVSGSAALDTIVDTQYIPARTRILADPVAGSLSVVRTFVEAADTALNSCRRVLKDCTAHMLTADSLADSLRAQRDYWKRVARPALSKNLYVASDLRGGIYGGIEARVRLLGLEGFARYEVRADSLAGSVRVGAVLRF